MFLFSFVFVIFFQFFPNVRAPPPNFLSPVNPPRNYSFLSSLYPPPQKILHKISNVEIYFQKLLVFRISGHFQLDLRHSERSDMGDDENGTPIFWRSENRKEEITHVVMEIRISYFWFWAFSK